MSRPRNSLHARSAVWRTVRQPGLYFHVSFAVFPCGNAYCLRQHSHRTVEAGWHLRQSGPSYGALTVHGISGAHQRPAHQSEPTRLRSCAPYGARSMTPPSHGTGTSPPPTEAPQSHWNRRRWATDPTFRGSNPSWLREERQGWAVPSLIRPRHHRREERSSRGRLSRGRA